MARHGNVSQSCHTLAHVTAVAQALIHTLVHVKFNDSHAYRSEMSSQTKMKTHRLHFECLTLP